MTSLDGYAAALGSGDGALWAGEVYQGGHVVSGIAALKRLAGV
jgi:hypothetical protein